MKAATAAKTAVAAIAVAVAVRAPAKRNFKLPKRFKRRYSLKINFKTLLC